jgi:hypothetical protein
MKKVIGMENIMEKEQPIDGYLYQIEYFPTETRTKNLISKNGYFNLVK